MLFLFVFLIILHLPVPLPLLHLLLGGGCPRLGGEVLLPLDAEDLLWGASWARIYVCDGFSEPTITVFVLGLKLPVLIAKWAQH